MSFRVTIDAFALSPGVETALVAAGRERALQHSRLGVHAGGLPGAIVHLAHNPTPQVVIVEENDDDRTMLGRLEQLAEVCDPGTRVIVIGSLNDIGLYRTLLGHGVSEYLVAPVTPGQIAGAVSALFADPAAAPRGKVTALWSARGGAGASTIARNLAWHMGKALGEQAIYLDLDMTFGASDLAFNLEARQSAAEVLAQPERLDSVLLDRFLVVHDDYLRLLPSGGAAPRSLDIQTEAAEQLVDLAARMAPALVLDLPHVWAPWTEALLRAADEVVVVARPDLASLRDCKLLLESLAANRNGNAPARLVINGLDLCRKTQLTVKDFHDTLAVAPALVLPWDSVLFGEAGNNGQLLAELGKGHKIVGQLESLAATLVGRGQARKDRGGKTLWSWLKG
ncbi:Pilus assembly protein cpaE [Magnetospirillum gryphiswaldense MSR-1 v2]|uniref:Pilus assembly protein cpaE n=1 Tax=Magnetospirillum gryphiswaldense (strain DSM 6361 / JCM 21280 / NBRC 15271 / MSR-1) TaxID=431944 RepID=V6F0B6_MAGGM|nr:cellulose synthase operon protein YhjQ/BcsQ [Magnetospirillum gryphiswaldense]CDK98822.1 Pilus assembly protein cpaE [Magnetospirillum gryphiswaldense MSR-1 v2]